MIMRQSSQGGERKWNRAVIEEVYKYLLLDRVELERRMLRKPNSATMF